MKTWNDYKEHVKKISPEERRNMDAIEDAIDLIIAEQALAEYEKNPVSYTVKEILEKYGLDFR